MDRKVRILHVKILFLFKSIELEVNTLWGFCFDIYSKKYNLSFD